MVNRESPYQITVWLRFLGVVKKQDSSWAVKQKGRALLITSDVLQKDSVNLKDVESGSLADQGGVYGVSNTYVIGFLFLEFFIALRSDFC
jgi:hypothetical protein